MTGDAPFASPALPTPLATLTTAVPDGPVAVLRWRRRDGANGTDGSDGTSDGTTRDTSDDEADDGAEAVEGAPPGWRPSAGSVAALPGPAPAQWLVGVGEGRPRDWRAAGAAAVRALRDASGRGRGCR